MCSAIDAATVAATIAATVAAVGCSDERSPCWRLRQYWPCGPAVTIYRESRFSITATTDRATLVRNSSAFCRYFVSRSQSSQRPPRRLRDRLDGWRALSATRRVARLIHQRRRKTRDGDYSSSSSRARTL